MALLVSNASLPTRQTEVRVFDQADDVPERVGDRPDLDPVPDVVRRLLERGSDSYELRDRLIDGVDAPVRDGAAGPRRCPLGTGVQPELIPADVEADVEGLVEVRRLLKHRRVPRLGAIEVPDVIDDGRESFDHRAVLLGRSSSPSGASRAPGCASQSA